MKNYEQILVNLCGGVGDGPRKKWFQWILAYLGSLLLGDSSCISCLCIRQMAGVFSTEC